MNTELIKIEVNNISDVILLSTSLQNFDFRGQGNILWQIQSNLERSLKDFDLFAQTENNIISRFKQRSANYLDRLPSAYDYFDWLTYIQHYGGPTRLVDFSSSIYIASFFAFNEYRKGDKPVIWAINGKKLNKRIKLEITGSEYESYQIPQNSKYENYKNIENFFDYHRFLNDLIEVSTFYTYPAICRIVPDNQFPRLAAQQGVFYSILSDQAPFFKQLSSIIDLNDENSLISNCDLVSTFDSQDLLKNDPLLVRISFSESFPCNIYCKELEKMNITTETMFPGLDGLGMYLQKLLPNE